MSIETATRAGSLAITRGTKLLAHAVGDPSISHSTNLLEQIGVVLTEAKVALREIDAFAVATGPGSFTGLRIGLATAKSFAATLGRPCVGVQTLHAIAHSAGESECTVAMLPAGRGEVFVQRLSVKSDGEVIALEAATHIKPERLLEQVSTERRLKWAGEGASMYAEAIEAEARSRGIPLYIEEGREKDCDEDCWRLVRATDPLAASVARLALRQAPFDENANPQNLRAVYVRASDAEINEQWQG